MKDKILPKITHWFLRFVQVQLVISLTLLMILPSWGLPMSILSPLGNIVCSPLFIIFLLLSAILFFLELIGIPNGFFIYLLEKLTTVWLWLVPDCNNRFLICFTKPPLLFLLILPIAIIAILTNNKIRTIHSSIISLLILFSLSCAYLKIINRPNILVTSIPCNKGYVTFLYNHGKTALIDPGHMGSRVSAVSWVSFTLIPQIIKSCGSTHIDHLIIMQPGKITFDAIQALLQSLDVKNLYLINFYGPLKRNTAKSLYALKELAKKRNTRITRIGNKKASIWFGQTSDTKISITPQHKRLTYNKTKYPGLCTTCTIDNQTIKIYSAKMKIQ